MSNDRLEVYKEKRKGKKKTTTKAAIQMTYLILKVPHHSAAAVFDALRLAVAPHPSLELLDLLVGSVSGNIESIHLRGARTC